VKKTLVARDVVEKLYAAENSIDASLEEVSRLLTAMIQGRQELGLAATVGADAITRIGEAMTALSAARAAAVAGHHELKAVHDALGLRGVATMGKHFIPVLVEDTERRAS
jgi:hypothetical protein